MMTSPFIIEKFEPVFQKYHYMSYSYIVPRPEIIVIILSNELVIWLGFFKTMKQIRVYGKNDTRVTGPWRTRSGREFLWGILGVIFQILSL